VRRVVAAAIVLGLFVLVLPARPTSAAPAAPAASFQLARARAEFERGEYQRVADTLAPELYPKNKIPTVGELKEAHYLLGSSYFFLNRQDLARQEFTALLFLDPAHELDPAVDPPRVYAFFQTLKHELAEKLQLLEANRKVDPPPPSREVLIETTIREPAPAVTNFVPLGYGQFRNGQKGKGWFFLASEALLGGTSIALFTYQAVNYDKIRNLQIMQIATGSLFLVLYGVGVYDSFTNQKPVVETKRSERPLDTPAKPAKSISLEIVPLVSPDGAGLGAMGRF
jgi:hypothetical protein